MKIRDISCYLNDLSKVGIVYDENVELATKEDKLLHSLYMEIEDVATLRHKLSQLTSFATDTYDQVFYEFLQNAKDSGGTGLWTFFQKNNGIIFLNNGRPFHTDTKILHESLNSFLGKENSDKFKTEGQSGSKGKGSKLLYNLLVPINAPAELKGVNVRVVAELVEKLKSPILFSWKKGNVLKEILEVRNIDEFGVDAKSSILCKLFLSYFPALPNQKLKFNGEIVTPFDQRGFEEFQKSLKAALMVFKNDQLFLSPGNLIYIPSPDSVITELEMEIETIKNGLSQSLTTLFLDPTSKLERVIINGDTIEKNEAFNFKVSTIDNGVPILAELIFKQKPTLADLELPNLFTDYFPISRENHQLGYFIKCKNFDTTDSRQNIKENKSLFKALGQSAVDSWDQISGNGETYLALIQALALSKMPEKEMVRVFHEAILSKAKTQTPTNLFNYPHCPSRNLIALPKGFEDLDVSLLLEDKYPLHKSLYDFIDPSPDVDAEIGLQEWGVEIYSLTQLFSESDPKKVISFFKKSKERDKLYEQLEKELKFEENEISFLNLPIIPADNSYLSIQEFLEGSQLFLTFPEKNFRLFKHQSEKDGVKITFSEGTSSFINVDHHPNIAKVISKAWNSKLVFQRIAGFFENDQLKFNSHLKKSLFKSLLEFDPKGFANFLLHFDKFSNRKKDRDLTIIEIIPSSKGNFFRDWSLKGEDDFEGFETFMANDADIWEIVYNDPQYLISKIQKFDRPSLIKKIFESLIPHFNKSTLEKRSFFKIDDALFFSADEKWATFSEGIALKSFSNLNEQEFLIVKRLFKKSGFSIPHFDLRSFYTRLPKHCMSSLSQWKPQAVRLDLDELDVIKTLFDSDEDQFFNQFILRKEIDGQYSISSKTDEVQVFNLDRGISDFLKEENGYVELPSGLGNRFSTGDGLFDGSTEGFLARLIKEFGSIQPFLAMVLKSGEIIKKFYLEKLGNFQLSSQSTEPLSSNSFLVELIDGFYKETYFKLLTDKITFDGKKLNKSYRDDFKLNEHEYNLSKIFTSDEFLDAAKVTSKINMLLVSLKPKALENLLGFTSFPAMEIKNKIIAEGLSNTHQVCFLIDFMEVNKEEKHNYLQHIEGLEEISLRDLLIQFKSKKVEWKKYWKDITSVFNPYKQIIGTRTELWRPQDLVPSVVLEWGREKDENSEYLSGILEFQRHVHAIEKYRDALLLGNAGAEPCALWLENTLEWCAFNNLTFREAVGKPFFKLIEESLSLWKTYFFHYHSWGEDHERLVTVGKVKNEISYYFEKDEYIKYVNEDILAPTQVFLKTSAKIIKFHNLNPLNFRTELNSLITDEKEWDAPYYEKWKNLNSNHYSYRIFGTKSQLSPNIIIENDGVELGRINGSKGEPVLRLPNKRKVSLYVSLLESSSITLQLLEQHKEILFPNESAKNDFIKLLSIINEDQGNAIQKLISQGIIDEKMNPISKDGEGVGKDKGSTGSGNIFLEGLNDLDNPALVEEAWPLIKELIEKFGNEALERLQDAIMAEKDDSKPNMLSGYFGEKLFESWANVTGLSASYVGDHVWEYDVQSNRGKIEVKTKINSLYDEGVGGSGTTAVYLRKSQFDYLEANIDENYYLVMISLVDLSLRERYDGWKSKWKENEDLVKIEVDQFTADFMKNYGNQHDFRDKIKFLKLQDGKAEMQIE